MYISPAAVTVKALTLKKVEYQNALRGSTDLTKTRDDKLIGFNTIAQADIDKLNKIIPDSFNAVVFANTINTLASQYGLTVRDFKVNQPKTEARDIIVVKKKDSYRTINVSFRINGQYDQFIKFLNNVESDLHLVDVSRLSVRPTGGQKIAESSYEYLLEVQTYSLR